MELTLLYYLGLTDQNGNMAYVKPFDTLKKFYNRRWL